ncbi:MAG: ABC transporter ATP-binding protein [Clostridiales bacterium]|jgi:ABC-2 type transport system ATP-binding protein|nr:ABC transporter ATP-binding protein [Clostridiales bacterium]
MLKITNLTKTYAGGGVKAVDCVNLTVLPGEIFGFLGPNGAGKSTTIKSVIGVLPFEEGTIEIFGEDIKKNPLAAKKNIGYVPDNHVIYDKLTGIEYLDFMADVYGIPAAKKKERIEKYAELFSLKDVLNDPIKKYSHGMKQKICVIGAILHEPKLWVLDEPLTGLDPQSAYDLKQLMREHCKKGNTVFFSSHVLDVAEKLCDRIAVINKGKIVVDTSMSDLKALRRDETLEEYFLSITRTEGGEV